MAGRSTRSLGCMKISVALAVIALTFIATCLTACIQRPVNSEAEMKRHRTDSSFSLDLELFLASWGVMLAGVGAAVCGFAWVARLVHADFDDKQKQ
jgi:hypothetical protein